MSRRNPWRTDANNLTRAIERGAPIDWERMCSEGARVVLAYEPIGSSRIIIHGGELARIARTPADSLSEYGRAYVSVVWWAGDEYDLGLAGPVASALFPAPLPKGATREPRWEMYAIDAIHYTHPTAARERFGEPYVATIGPDGDTRGVYINGMTKNGPTVLEILPTSHNPESLAVAKSAVQLNSHEVTSAWQEVAPWWK